MRIDIMLIDIIFSGTDLPESSRQHALRYRGTNVRLQA